MEVHVKCGNELGIVSGAKMNDWKNEFSIYNLLIDEYWKKFHYGVKNLGKSTKLAANEWELMVR